jgi:hemerythrin-like domain-containing protein
MDITAVLTEHHTTLRQLFEQSMTQIDVFDEFIHHLTVHHTMEEKYFYDILEQEPQGHHDALEAVNEHHIIELIIKDAERFPRDHERFPIKVESLGEYTTHHLDEEENTIFPMAQQVLPEEELVALGKLFMEAKDKLLGVTLPKVPGAIAARSAKRPAIIGKRAPIPSQAPARANTAVPQDLGIGSLKK